MSVDPIGSSPVLRTTVPAPAAPPPKEGFVQHIEDRIEQGVHGVDQAIGTMWKKDVQRPTVEARDDIPARGKQSLSPAGVPVNLPMEPLQVEAHPSNADFKQRIEAKLGMLAELTRGLPAAIAHSIQQHAEGAADAVAFTSTTTDAELNAMPTRALATTASELLRMHGHGPQDVAASDQFMRVLTAHGTDAGHVDAILSRVERGPTAGAKLQGAAAVKFLAMQHDHQAVPGDWNGFQGYLNNATDTVPRPGSSVEPLIDGSTAFPAMLSAIDHAATSVNMSVFSFQSDEAGWDFAHHLAAAADRGCSVRLLYDPIGSRLSNGQPTDPKVYAYLKEHGVQIVAQQPGPLADHLTHRKIIVVDGSTGFIGGMNVGDEYRDQWHDVHSRVTGPAVADLQHLFVDQWTGDGGTIDPSSEAALYPTLQPVPGAGSAQIVGHLGHQDHNMKLAYLRAIDTATSSINIADPYFSDPDVIAHLEAAARRGVKVQIFLPETNNHKLEEDAEQGFYPTMLKAGVQIYEYHGRPMAHDKVATFDGRVATIGSSNLDTMSITNNDEANVWAGPDVAANLNQNLFAADIPQSDHITIWRPRSLQAVADDIGKDISPLM